MSRREKYQNLLGWKKVKTSYLDNAIDEIVPPSFKIEINTKTRSRETVHWRNVLMLCYWLNDESILSASKRFDKNHATLLNGLKHLEIDLEGFDDELKYAERIKQINKKAYIDYERFYKEYQSIEFDNVTVFYDVEYYKFENWHEIKIVNVSALVQDTFITDGEQLITIDCYDETILVEEIKRKLKIDGYDNE